MKKKGNLVIGIYFHPEAFPPTLNAVSELADCFDKVTILHRPHLKGNWKYPFNVVAKAPGRQVTSAEQQAATFLSKIWFYIQFLFGFLKVCLRQRPAIILVYDNLSLLAYRLVKPFLFFPHKIWYHNHDVSEKLMVRKYSIGWFALKSEIKAFDYLDIFSLPSNDRRRYFPMDRFRGKYFYLPNFPSIRFYSSFYRKRVPENPIKLIFQGSIGPFHGIEEIIPLLGEKINDFGIELVLKGPCREDYQKQCIALAAGYNVIDRLCFVGVTPYSEVPALSSQCHIGIGMLAKQDIMNKTLGTASNKLYEYAAVGLPVIYYNSPDFTQYLGGYVWATPADLSTASIRAAISRILSNYQVMSSAARDDFMKSLNFEYGFKPVKVYLDLMPSN